MLKNYLKETVQEFVKKGEDFTAYEVSRAMNDRLISEGEDPIRHLLIRDIVHEILNEFINNGELDKISGMYKGYRCQIYSPICKQTRKVNDGAGNAAVMTKDGPKTGKLSNILNDNAKNLVNLTFGPDTPSPHSNRAMLVNKTKYGVNIPAALCRYAGIKTGLTVVVNGNFVQNYGQHKLRQNRSYTVDKHNEVRLTNAALNDMKIKSNVVKLTASKTGYVKVEEV